MMPALTSKIAFCYWVIFTCYVPLFNQSQSTQKQMTIMFCVVGDSIPSIVSANKCYQLHRTAGSHLCWLTTIKSVEDTITHRQ